MKQVFVREEGESVEDFAVSVFEAEMKRAVENGEKPLSDTMKELALKAFRIGFSAGVRSNSLEEGTAAPTQAIRRDHRAVAVAHQGERAELMKKPSEELLFIWYRIPLKDGTRARLNERRLVEVLDAQHERIQQLEARLDEVTSILSEWGLTSLSVDSRRRFRAKRQERCRTSQGATDEGS